MNHTDFATLVYAGAKPYRPKINRKRQAGLIGFMLSAISADVIIPCTFGQITRGASKLIKYRPLFLYN